MHTDSSLKKSSDLYLASEKKLIPELDNVVSDEAAKPHSIKERVIKPRLIGKTLYEHIYEELKALSPDEHIIWIGRSSQAIHLVAYTICFLFGFLVVPLFIALYLYLRTKNTIYVVTEQRLRVYSGILNKRIDDLELYRVKDSRYRQSFLLRFFNLSNITLFTSDISWGDSEIPGIENGMSLREELRKRIELARIKFGVREIDYYNRKSLS